MRSIGAQNHEKPGTDDGVLDQTNVAWKHKFAPMIDDKVRSIQEGIDDKSKKILDFFRK